MTDENTNQPHYPDVEVQLTGTDGNAFLVLGKVQRALQHAGVDEAEVNRFHQEATSGDYSNLLVTCGKWVSIA